MLVGGLVIPIVTDLTGTEKVGVPVLVVLGRASPDMICIVLMALDR